MVPQCWTFGSTQRPVCRWNVLSFRNSCVSGKLHSGEFLSVCGVGSNCMHCWVCDSIDFQLFVYTFSQIVCLLCSYYCNTTRLSAVSGACPIGTYCPAGSINPVVCTAGRYCATTGLSVTTGICTAANYCPTGSTSATQIICPDGYYCPTGSASPIICPIGSFCPAPASVNTVCTAGYCSFPCAMSMLKH
jgi:hypothetical protein